jgi:hypothetical protein
LFKAKAEKNDAGILLVAGLLGGGSTHAIILCYVRIRDGRIFCGGWL